jgi:hypothetical protein
MGSTLFYRTCQTVSPEREAAIRSAADSFNRGRSWVLAFDWDKDSGRLVCRMATTGPPDISPVTGKVREWPGPYEAQCLLEGLCAISRDLHIDWEIHDPYSVRPLGVIRDGRCHHDPEAIAESVLRMGEDLRNRGVWRP